MIADIPVILPEDDTLVLSDQHIGTGLKESETELPDDAAGTVVFLIRTIPLAMFIVFLF